MTLAKTNTNAEAYVEASGLSALKLLSKGDEGLKALMLEGRNALHDLLGSGDWATRSLTLDGGRVDLAQAMSATIPAAAGFKNQAGASLA